ncbi:hypothetical protein PMIN07_007713 [Paraphaeosphaeria minitans]
MVIESVVAGEGDLKGDNDPGDIGTYLHNLLFVNRQISHLALFCLYRKIIYNNFPGNPDALQKLIIPLLSNPAKAKLVKSFNMQRFDQDARQSDEHILKNHELTWEQRFDLRQIPNVLKKYEGSLETKKGRDRDFYRDFLMSATLA